MSVLDELERLEKAATPCPWEWSGRKEEADEDMPDGVFVWHPQGSTLKDTTITLGDTYEDDHYDLDLIAASRNALPALLRLARAAEREFNHPEEEVRFEAGRDVRQALRDLGVEV